MPQVSNDSLRTVLLLSGGIDSTALVDFYLRRKAMLECVHFQYGQPSAESEKIAVEKVMSHYKVNCRVINLGFKLQQARDEFFCRNALFILIAGTSTLPPARIILGIHAGSYYYDSSMPFLRDCRAVLEGYFAGTVTLGAPFIQFTKNEIIDYCKKYDVPLDLTYSCIRQDHEPCGLCGPCLDRRLYYGN